MKNILKLTLLSLTVALTACGGGGGDGKTCVTDANLDKTCTITTHNLPEGIWLGASTSGVSSPTGTSSLLSSASVMTIVLETGAYFSVYTVQDAYTGLVQGTMNATNNQFQDDAAVAIDTTDTPVATTVSGIFTPNVSMSGNVGGTTTASGALALTFNGNYLSAYDTPLPISQVAGSWTDIVASGTDQLTITPSGAFTGTAGNCTVSGTMTPRATGKHILDGTALLSNNGSNVCPAGNGTTTPFEATLVNGQLTLVGVTPQRNHAFVMNLVQ